LRPNTNDREPREAARAPWFLSFTRITSTGKFIPEIDGLRFIAIVSVILFHAYGFVIFRGGYLEEGPGYVQRLHAFTAAHLGGLGGLLLNGGFGVQLFFVISGFILGLPFAESRRNHMPGPSLKRFYLRRVTRLEPPYIVNILLLALLLVAVKGRPLAEVAPSCLASLCYVHNLVFGEYSRVNGVAWSLEIEIQFYLLAPVFATVFAIGDRRLRRTVLLALVAILAIGNGLLDSEPGRYRLSLLAQLQYFFGGFLLADLYLDAAPGTRSRSWDAFALAAWSALAVAVQVSWARPALPLLTVAAYYASLRGRIVSAMLRLPCVYLIGGMCYTIYLYHFAIISAVGPLTIGLCRPEYPITLNLLVQFSLLGLAIVALSSLLFLLLERPFMQRDWPVRLWNCVRAGSPATAEGVARAGSGVLDAAMPGAIRQDESSTREAA
jgi:peptidoglycan/LPS O-acetylase OafA/YrhL